MTLAPAKIAYSNSLLLKADFERSQDSFLIDIDFSQYEHATRIQMTNRFESNLAEATQPLYGMSVFPGKICHKIFAARRSLAE